MLSVFAGLHDGIQVSTRRVRRHGARPAATPTLTQHDAQTRNVPELACAVGTGMLLRQSHSTCVDVSSCSRPTWRPVCAKFALAPAGMEGCHGCHCARNLLAWQFRKRASLLVRLIVSPMGSCVRSWTNASLLVPFFIHRNALRGRRQSHSTRNQRARHLNRNSRVEMRFGVYDAGF